MKKAEAKDDSTLVEDLIKAVLPSTWYNDSIDMYIELPMHLLFLGITKTVIYVTKKAIIKMP